MHRRARVAASALLLTTSLACLAGADRVNADGFREYAEHLVRSASADASVRHCAMAPAGSRLGYCEIAGAGVSGLPSAFSLDAASPEVAERWRSSGNSGCAEGGWTARHPNASLHLATERSALPPSHGKGVLERIWIDGTEACFDLRYPYG